MSHRLLAVFLLASLACAASAERVGVVVQYDGTTVGVDCVSFSGSPSAYDVLMSSRFSIDAVDFPPFGPALCGIDSIGCPASNCFCDVKYWGFYYLQGSGWQYSNVGIGFPQDGGYQIVQDGAVIGFRWGDWGQQPVLKQFNEICAPAGAGLVHAAPPQKLVLNLSVGCGGEQASFVVTDEDGRIVPLAEVNVLESAPQPLRWMRVEKVVVDGDGRGVVVLPEEGLYRFEAMLPQYGPDQKEVYVKGCAQEEPVAVEAVVEQPVPVVVLAAAPKVDAPAEAAGILSTWAETGWEMMDWALWRRVG